jgi:hypothetical protein
VTVRSPANRSQGDKANTEVAQSKIVKNHANDRWEFSLGILVWPGLFDLKNADGNEANALLDRNIFLRGVAQENLALV